MALRARARTQAAMIRGFPLLLAAALSACAGGTLAPDWRVNAHEALAAHVQSSLKGDTRIAAHDLAIARNEAGRTGSAEPLARVELTACAVRIASLAGEDCPEAQPLLRDAGEASRAYAAYLAGRWDGLDRARLPPAQRDVPVATDAVAKLNGIDEPFSRLVAAALLLRAGRLPPEGIAVAIDTASEQGWRRPLLAWLMFDRDRLAAAGDSAAAAERQRRIDYVRWSLRSAMVASEVSAKHRDPLTDAFENPIGH